MLIKIKTKPVLLSAKFLLLMFLVVGCSASTSNEKNNSKSTKWIKIDKQIKSVSPEIDNFLKSVNGNIRLLYCKYDKADLIATHPLSINETSFDENKWNTTIKTNSVKSGSDALDLNIQFQLKEGFAKEAGVAIAFDFKKWNTEKLCVASCLSLQW